MKVTKISLLVCLLLIGNSALSRNSLADELYLCDTHWTNKPCDSASETIKVNAKQIEAPLPTAISAEPTAPSSASSSSIDLTQFQIKPLVKERPTPNMEWRRDELTQNKWRFSGKLSGNGKTRISLIISKASYTGKVSREYPAFDKIFDLAPWGEQQDFSFTVDVPAPERSWAWRWFLKAEYLGKWEGYRDFRGCCAEDDEKAFCGKTGDVICRGSKISAACRCF